MSSFREVPWLQNNKYTASPVVRTDIETEGNVIQIIMKAKFMAGEAFMMAVENKKFIKDSGKGC